MMSSFSERPVFFPGEFLSDEELNALSDYFRQRSARHALALHSWGIAAGLDLVEHEAVGGGMDVFLQPGYAFDGYGRPIVVTEPYKLPGDLFAQASSGLVAVWLRYVETSGAGVRPGFRVCECDAAYKRVDESWVVEAGERESARERHSGIETASGPVEDPREILRASVDDAPLICDGSVPFQTLPEAKDAFWLIPLGYVSWQAGAPGQLVARTEEQQRLSRAARRQVGLVTEGIHAANGVIRLRDRFTGLDAGFDSETRCALEAMGEADFDIDSGPVVFEDLVWIEGNLRIEGNARLFGTKLEFRDADGEERDVPLYLRRNPGVGIGPDGQDLALVLGPEAGSQDHNRLIVGTEKGDGSHETKLVITDGGKLGIGVGEPQAYADGADALVIGGADEQGMTIAAGAIGRIRFADGTGEDQAESGRIAYDHGTDTLSLGADGEDRVWLTGQGHLGIGTEAPGAGLHVVTGSDATLAANSGMLIINEIDGPNLVMDGNEIQARDDGSTSPLYLQAEGGSLVYNRHQGESQRITFVQQGRIGIGEDNPRCPLHIANGTDVTLGDSSGYLLLGSVGGHNLVIDDNEIQARDNGAGRTLHLQLSAGDVNLSNGTLWTRANGRVGVGTNDPRESLEVRGNLRLGGSGELFAPGGPDNLRILVGRVLTNGAHAFGSGFQCARVAEGQYRVDFDTSFAAPPAVVVTTIEQIGGPSAHDNLATVDTLGSGGFNVRFKDTTPTAEGDFQNSEFCFIVTGLR
jgi:hypothetical protein